MAIKTSSPSLYVLSDSFGFDPEQASAYFLVNIPAGATMQVEISEHLSWDPDKIEVHLNSERNDGQVRCRLAREKWNEIAEVMRAEFNARLRKMGDRPGKWKAGYNPVSRLLGKELVVLAWAIEDACPALIPVAVANWQGLSPEERWWLYTMTAAATGNAVTGRNRGWRKAVRFALTENPTACRVTHEPVVPEFFRLVSESAAAEGQPAVLPHDHPLKKRDEQCPASEAPKRRTRKLPVS
jgi:hypothetical protein